MSQRGGMDFGCLCLFYMSLVEGSPRLGSLPDQPCQSPVSMCAWGTSSALLLVEPETWKAAAVLQHSQGRDLRSLQVTGEAVLGQSSWRRQPLPSLFTSLNVCLLVKPYVMVRTLYLTY